MEDFPKGAGGNGEARNREKGISGNKEDHREGAGGLLTKDGEMGKGQRNKTGTVHNKGETRW